MSDRKHVLGATDAAAVLGLSDRESPLALYLRLHGDVEPEEQHAAALAAGKLAEDALLRPLVERATGWKLHRAPALALKDEPRIGVSPDFLRSGEQTPEAPEFVETKLTGSRAMWGPPGTREVPVHVNAQAQCQMAVARAVGILVPVVHVAVCWVPGFEISLYPVPEDQESGAAMLEAMRAFLRRVDEGNPPEPGSEADARRRFLAKHGLAHTLSAASQAKLSAIAVHRQNAREHAAFASELTKEVLLEIGEATELLHCNGSGQIVGTCRAKRVFDPNLLRAQRPDVFDEFTVPTLDKSALRKKRRTVYEMCMREPVTIGEQARALKIAGVDDDEGSA